MTRKRAQPSAEIATTYGPDFAALYAVHWAEWTHRMWPVLEKLVLKHVPQSQSWLDLCCGTGTLLATIPKHYESVGVDISADQLSHAKKTARRAELIQADARTLRLGRRFDVVTCLFDSMNYLLRPGDVARVLNVARRHLSDGGLLLFDINTIVGFAKRYRATYSIETHDQFATVVSSYNWVTRRGLTQVIGFVKEGRHWRRYDEEHDQRAYTREEIERMTVDAGLAFRVYDGDRLGRVRKNSGRMLFACWHAKSR